MKRTGILILFFWMSAAGPVVAQVDQDFESFVKRTQKDFQNFQERTNAEFAAFLKESWEKFSALSAVLLPVRPEPVKPVVLRPQDKPIVLEYPISLVIKIPALPRPEPIPDELVRPSGEKKNPEPDGRFEFLFFNTPCRVNIKPDQTFALNDISEKSIGKAWEELSGPAYNSLIAECLDLKTELALNDWGYVSLVKQLAQACLGEGRTNECIFMQMYILARSGYKAKVARADQQLVLCLAMNNPLYGISYIKMDGDTYYLMNMPQGGKTIYTYTKNFYDKAFPLDMHIETEPHLKLNLKETHYYQAWKYPDLIMHVGVNENLIQFYKTYPQCDWLIYAQTPMSLQLREAILPVLKAAIQGKEKTEAAGIILDFVQTAFKYKTDEEQFGYEKPFFPDEVFYYPYSDCEDRAILYTTLVKELLGLEVVLLHYPDHLATAVCFQEEAEGDYIIIEGRKFLICDPTYINAPIGCAMPQYKNVGAEVIRFPR